MNLILVSCPLVAMKRLMHGCSSTCLEVNDTDVVVLGARAFALRGATQHLPSLVRAKRHPIRRGRKIACLTNRFCKCQSRQSKKQIYSDCFRQLSNSFARCTEWRTRRELMMRGIALTSWTRLRQHATVQQCFISAFLEVKSLFQCQVGPCLVSWVFPNHLYHHLISYYLNYQNYDIPKLQNTYIS